MFEAANVWSLHEALSGKMIFGPKETQVVDGHAMNFQQWQFESFVAKVSCHLHFDAICFSNKFGVPCKSHNKIVGIVTPVLRLWRVWLGFALLLSYQSANGPACAANWFVWTCQRSSSTKFCAFDTSNVQQSIGQFFHVQTTLPFVGWLWCMFLSAFTIFDTFLLQCFGNASLCEDKWSLTTSPIHDSNFLTKLEWVQNIFHSWKPENVPSFFPSINRLTGSWSKQKWG